MFTCSLTYEVSFRIKGGAFVIVEGQFTNRKETIFFSFQCASIHQIEPMFHVPLASGLVNFDCNALLCAHS